MLLLLILSVVVLFTSSPDSWWLDFVVPFIMTVSAGDGDEASLLGDFDTTTSIPSCVPLALKLSSWWLPFAATCSVSWLWPLVWCTSTLEGDSQVSRTGVELILWSFSPETDRSWKLVEGEFGVASDVGLIGDSSPWWPLDPLVVGLGTGVFNWITLDWVPRMIRSLDLYQSSPSWSMTKSLVSWGIALIRSTT